MGTFRKTPKICPKMEKPPKDSRKTAADARSRRLSGERETPWMPFVISSRPPENACKNSGETGRKDKALESKVKKPNWASPSCKTQKHTRKPPICAEMCIRDSLYPMYGFLLFCHNKRSSYDLNFTIEEPLQLHIYRKSFTLPIK